LVNLLLLSIIESIEYLLLLIPYLIFVVLLALVFFAAVSIFVYTLFTKEKPTKLQVIITSVSIVVVGVVYSLFVSPLDQRTLIAAPLYLFTGIIAAFLSANLTLNKK
jgi:uncharacterized membrane protein YwzB